MERIAIDYTLCMEEALGPRKGLSRFLLEALRLPLEEARGRLAEKRHAGGLAWMDLPRRDASDVLDFAERATGRYDDIVVLGIGGSALGTTALTSALLHPFHNSIPAAARGGRPRVFVVDNVDPDEIGSLFTHLDLERTLVNVISKSGTTAETMAAYLVARGLLVERVGEGALRDHLAFTTDPHGGVLRKIGRQDGIPLFDVGAGVGGRFSVLSPVGLLPAALAGIDVVGLLAGAAEMDQWIAEADVMSNPAYLFATLQFLQDTRFQRHLSVMMPYSRALRDVAVWYRQLWAESLGKAVDRRGRTVHVGPTPIDALGATDQHSQVQLYTEGPDDKVFTFLRVDEFSYDVVIPDLHAAEESLAYLGGRSMSDLLNAEQEATAWALAQRGRPSLTISVPRVDAGSVGQVLYLLEVAVSVAGELYDINAFDQPGVELGKQATYALMGRAGFEELAGRIRGTVGGDGSAAGVRYLVH
ncbi:MAG TPA: glucose-6-phosphate isomerase [Thermoleophilia bacterium]|nr:glucose-6-phosphate isomerase [Thermoleophilia bacterium]